MTWRDIAREHIVRVLKETEGQSEKEIKKALFNAYPFGERRFWPYRTWLSEIKNQRRLWTRRIKWEQGSLLEKGKRDVLELSGNEADI